MPVFAVIAASDEPRLGEAVSRAFPNDSYVMGPGQYLVADDRSTTPEIGEKLGVRDGVLGKVFITPVQNYFGWHNMDLWEWIAARSVPAGLAAFEHHSRNG